MRISKKKAIRFSVQAAVVILAIGFLPSLAYGQRGKRRSLRVQINSNPSGASVKVDGEDSPSGNTPLWVDLRRGTHRIQLELDRHAPLETEINVRRAWARFNFDLTSFGKLDLRPSNESAQGATVHIDGQQVGTIPLSHDIAPGRHSFTVEREGYHPETRWFEVSGGQTYVIEMTLRPLPPPRGEILVAADVPGATILVDNVTVGTTPNIIEAEPGQRQIEIRSQGLEPYRETVVVEANSRVTVNGTLRQQQPPSGTLVVLTNPSGATIFIDGIAKGTSPTTIRQLSPGSHIVEARLAGFHDASELVEIEENRQVSKRLSLTESTRRGGLRVTSSQSGADVFLDGRLIGRTPLVYHDIEPGEHVVVVRSDGHQEWERRIQFREGVELLVEATPDTLGHISVRSNIDGAQIIVDGEVIGVTPMPNLELSTGDHTIEIISEGESPFKTTVTVDSGRRQEVNAIFGKVAGILPETEQETETQPATVDSHHSPNRSGPRFTHSGFPPPPYSIYINASWGWPYIAGYYRLGLGIWDGLDWARLDFALEVRSSVWMTEIDAHLRFGTRFARVMRVGLDLGLGGGIGRAFDTTSENRAGFILNLTLTEGFVVKNVAFGLNQRLEVFIDTHGDTAHTGLIRHTGARVFVGGFIEWSIVKNFHIFLIGDYAPAQSSRRILCGNAWNSTSGSCSHQWMEDINLNIQAGMGLRFL